MLEPFPPIWWIPCRLLDFCRCFRTSSTARISAGEILNYKESKRLHVEIFFKRVTRNLNAKWKQRKKEKRRKGKSRREKDRVDINVGWKMIRKQNHTAPFDCFFFPHVWFDPFRFPYGISVDLVFIRSVLFHFHIAVKPSLLFGVSIRVVTITWRRINNIEQPTS